MPSSSSSSSSSADDEGARGKRKRGSPGACASASGGDYHQGPSSKWRTPRAQQAYSSKLIQALRLVRTGGTPTCSASAPAVRDAAYRALAFAARGRSRWSRAILARSRRCRALHCLRARRPPPPRPRKRQQQQQQQQGGETEEWRPGGLAGRAKVLGRLVPGCRSLSLPALLAEVSDYIAALEMQVRAMGQLTHDLAASASASSSSAPTAAPSIAPP